MNEQHLTAQYKRWGPVVYRRCLRVLGDREEAKDATQHVFVQLLRHAHRLDDDPERVIAWLQSVATNVSLTRFRNRSRRERALQAVVEGEGSTPPDELLERSQLARHALQSAEADDRAVAERVLLSGQSHESAAVELGVSQKTVQRRLQRFLEGARTLLGGRS